MDWRQKLIVQQQTDSTKHIRHVRRQLRRPLSHTMPEMQLRYSNMQQVENEGVGADPIHICALIIDSMENHIAAKDI